MEKTKPIMTIDLFPQLDRMLITLLHSLTADEWEKPTVAPLWKVKDIAAHLLDGNIRGLSISRDRYFGEKPPEDPSYPASACRFFKPLECRLGQSY